MKGPEPAGNCSSTRLQRRERRALVYIAGREGGETDPRRFAITVLSNLTGFCSRMSREMFRTFLRENVLDECTHFAVRLLSLLCRPRDLDARERVTETGILQLARRRATGRESTGSHAKPVSTSGARTFERGFGGLWAKFGLNPAGGGKPQGRWLVRIAPQVAPVFVAVDS